MDFYITTYDAAQCSDKLEDLAWVCTANSVRNTNTVDTDFINGLVYTEEIDKIGTERIFS